MKRPGKSKQLLIFGTLLALLIAAVPILAFASPQASLDPGTQFYVAKPLKGAIQQLAYLTSQGEKADAALIRQMIYTPQSVWFTGGSPRSVQQSVKNTVQRAADFGTLPVLVAYNIPFRDCSQYSAGGAADTQAYKAWIDGFAAGIGNKPALVILEPDGLGIIPWYTPFRGLPSQAAGYEWCQPADADPASAADDRFEMLNYAVEALKAQPNASVYLDGTHSGWLGAGDAAHRLVQAGVSQADGFFLNVSNFQFSDRLAKYGAWVSKCIWFGSDPGSWGNGHYDWCASQYYPANPNDFSTWGLSDQWYAENVETQTWVPYPGDAGIKHFVVDTSRNGQGPWIPSAHPAGDPQDWCNPPDRGLGYRPTADTGVTLIDAYLWIKIPGASDGLCYRWTTGPLDPVREIQDPLAGVWFADMALELVQNADPPLP